VDSGVLEQLLGQGLSLAQIGSRTGLHESTVGYWVKKHGLRPVNRDRCLARGGLARTQLEALVQTGMSTGEIADAVGRSKATVRYWLTEYGLKTHHAVHRRVLANAGRRLSLECPRHGMTVFKRRHDGGYRCLKCRSEAVASRRRRVKEILVAEAGGRCQACGYDDCIAALEFHHVDPVNKAFALSGRGVARSLAKARAEAAKCVLLCSNCHVEIEIGVRVLS